jgi:signal transduction histidine kinase
LETLYVFILIITILITTVLFFYKRLLNKNKLIHLKYLNEIKELKENSIYYQLQLEATQTDLNNNIEFKEKVIGIIIHDIKSPIIFLDKITSDLNKKFNQLDTVVISSRINELNDCTLHLRFFVEDLLIWLKNTDNQFNLKKEIIPFNTNIKKHFSIYFDIAHKLNLTINLQSKEDFTLVSNIEILNIIIRNLLDNAIKYTKKGYININCFQDIDNYIVQISDSGIGMEFSKIIELEKGLITNKKNDSIQIGYRIVYDLVKILNGKIKISSSIGEGTSINILLPK